MRSRDRLIEVLGSVRVAQKDCYIRTYCLYVVDGLRGGTARDMELAMHFAETLTLKRVTHYFPKNTAYLFDVLRYAGSDLTGQTLAFRLSLLSRIRPVQCAQIAETYAVGLRSLYDRLTEPEDEGIVLKDPNSTLRSCDRDGVNAGWQVKCRRSTKNYSF